MSEVRNIPRLRFPEFKEEWIQNSLGDICSFSKGKGISKSDIIDDGVYECIRYGELYTHYNEVIDKVISKTNFSDNPVFSKINDVIIPASGETALDIATASCVLKKDVLLGGDLNIIRTKVNGVFLSYYLNNKRKKEIARLSQGNSVVHVYPSQLKTLKILIPHSDEFDKIADFLTAVDKRIELLEKKKTLLETYKKGVMKKIFNQEIRFKDDNGNDFPEWEEKKLGELFDFNRGSTLSKSDLDKDGVNKCIHYGELFTVYNETIKEIYSNTNKEGARSISGDILMPTSDVTPYGLATASCIQEDNVILGGDMNILRSKSDIDTVFFSYLLNFSVRSIIKLVTGTTIKHIYSKDLKTLVFNVPTEKSEQRKISDFLTSIDIQIELLESQIDKSKTWKKGLLQKMFV